MIATALPALVVLACTPSAQDRPSHLDDPLPAITTTPLVLPARPAEVRLDDVDPCGVLSQDERLRLSLDNPPTAYVEPAFGNAKACTIRSTISGNVLRLALVTEQGVDVWLDENAQVEAQVISVAGYPALTVRTPGLEHLCTVEVDVAKGQFLDVMFRDGGNTTALPQDTLCLGAERAAEAAMAALLRKR